MQAGSALSPATAASISSCVAVAGRSTRIDSMPTSAQSLCLPLTYHREPGVVADQHGAQPGHDPGSRSSATRSVSSPLIAAAVAVPSSFCAVTAVILLRASLSGRSAGCR